MVALKEPRTAELIPLPQRVPAIRWVIHPDHPDFIRTYARYADVVEMPRAMHQAVGVQVVASVLNEWRPHPPRWIVIPARPLDCPVEWQCFGRSTLVTFADRVVEGADLGGLVRNTQWGSAPAFYQQMAEHPTGVFVWGELSEKLKLLNDARFGGIKQWLTDRYDNPKIPEAITYRQTQKKSQNTPPITFGQAPRTNILATSSEDWFFNNLAHEDSAGGFVPRWVLVRATGADKIIPTPLMPDAKLLPGLISHLNKITQLRGDADLSDILPYYEKWYFAARQRFAEQPNRALAEAYFNRHRVHVLKLAVIYEVSRSLSLRPSEASWKRAERAARWLEETIFSLLSTGMSGEGFAMKKMEERIQSAGADGLALGDLTRAFQHEDPRRRQGRLATLKAADSISAFYRLTSGRGATILVHRNYVADYQAKNPGDKIIG